MPTDIIIDYIKHGFGNFHSIILASEGREQGEPAHA